MNLPDQTSKDVIEVREHSESPQLTRSVGAILSLPGSEGESLALTAGVVESLHLDLHMKGINLPDSLRDLDCSIFLSFKKFGN